MYKKIFNLHKSKIELFLLIFFSCQLFHENEYGKKDNDELSFKSVKSELSENDGSDESFKSVEFKNVDELPAAEEEEQSMSQILGINSPNSLPPHHSDGLQSRKL